ncbi:MAG: hypothetical protein F6J87_08325 [Spirulina sp. SIO3F2]|nr:hypothetical protein [Spirulina sp. SIO3F2]
MADYTSLAIGINRYQYIQPLSYAQQDAQAIHQLLVEETELPPEQALMLTDASPWVEQHTTEPTQATIQYWLNQWLPRQPKGLLWFFFSGYGVTWQDEDYLMPIDGNPADIPGTALHLPTVVNQIQQAGFQKILMLLDINRSPGVIAGQSVGSQIAQLAPEQGVSLVLSSQVEEASHEHGALGHGMFTAALLEGLRYYSANLTLDKLSHYLYERLPELSEHHWRPMQHPLIIIPSIESAQEPLLPRLESENIQMAAAPTPVLTAPPIEPKSPQPDPVEAAVSDDPDVLPPELLPEPLEAPPEAIAALNTPDVAAGNEPSLPPFGATPPPRGAVENPTPPPTEPPQPLAAPAVPEPLPRRSQPTQKQQSWLWYGSGALVFLGLLGVLWFFQNRDQAPVVEVPTPEAVDPSSNDSSAAAPAPPTSALPTATENPPAAQPTPSPSVPTTLAESQAILAKARTYIQSNQATGFSQAIAEASKIPPGAPLHAEAQADISRWSQVILDIARGRANQGDFAGAIAAAQLVSAQSAPAHQTAQQQLGQWQAQAEQQKKNSETIRTARRQIRATQASSFSDGIQTLRTIPAGQPGYGQAQDLIERWSKQIYLLANSRARQKNYKQAITTAQLVPQGTPSYDAAQQAIARWQQGKP